MTGLPVILYVSTPTYTNTDAEMTALYLQLRPHLGAALLLVTPGVERAEIVAAEWWRSHGLPVVDVPPRDKDGSQRHGRGANYTLTTYNPDFVFIAGLDRHTQVWIEKIERYDIRWTPLGFDKGDSYVGADV